MIKTMYNKKTPYTKQNRTTVTLSLTPSRRPLAYTAQPTARNDRLSSVWLRGPAHCRPPPPPRASVHCVQGPAITKSIMTPGIAVSSKIKFNPPIASVFRITYVASRGVNYPPAVSEVLCQLETRFQRISFTNFSVIPTPAASGTSSLVNTDGGRKPEVVISW